MLQQGDIRYGMWSFPCQGKLAANLLKDSIHSKVIIKGNHKHEFEESSQIPSRVSSLNSYKETQGRLLEEFGSRRDS